MNILILTGNLVRDLELKRTQSGKAVCDGTIAVSKEYVKEAYFINFQAWGNQAEYLSRYAKKGTNIELSGTLAVEQYQTKNGYTQYKYFMLVDKSHINYAAKKEEFEEPSKEVETEIAEQSAVDLADDALPF